MTRLTTRNPWGSIIRNCEDCEKFYTGCNSATDCVQVLLKRLADYEDRAEAGEDELRQTIELLEKENANLQVHADYCESKYLAYKDEVKVLWEELQERTR